MYKMNVEGDLPVDKGTGSNLLAEGPKWVAKGLIKLKEHDVFIEEKARSHDLQLVLATPKLDQTPASEVRTLTIAETIEDD